MKTRFLIINIYKIFKSEILVKLIESLLNNSLYLSAPSIYFKLQISLKYASSS